MKKVCWPLSYSYDYAWTCYEVGSGTLVSDTLLELGSEMLSILVGSCAN